MIIDNSVAEFLDPTDRSLAVTQQAVSRQECPIAAIKMCDDDGKHTNELLLVFQSWFRI